MKEPEIIINGSLLDDGLCLTIRVALESYYVDLLAHGLGDDEMGKKLTLAYIERLEQLRNIIYLN